MSVKAMYPFTEFVLKIYERCNLACTYCYMYEMADQSWQDKPVKMSPKIFVSIVERIAEHVNKHHLDEISVVFHGGEPLMRGYGFITWAVNTLREELVSCTVHARIQTNGVLLDVPTLNALLSCDVKVGVSLDGSKAANDRHRITRKGASSFDAVVDGISLLRKERFSPLYRGIYCTIDIENDPVETYDFLSSLAPPMLDFILPHANWNAIPNGDTGRYGKWLIDVFDCWYGKADLSIRLFDNIIMGLLGGRSELETIGASPVCTAFIDTDGSINQVDALKSACEGAESTGFSVISSSLDDALAHPDVQHQQGGIDVLSDSCKKCDLVDICGGGHYPHRYQSDSAFNNPSVYCAALSTLIRHIAERIECAASELAIL